MKVPKSDYEPLPMPPTVVHEDENGNEVPMGSAGGLLVIKKPWPSMLRTIWGDDERYVTNYWSRFGDAHEIRTFARGYGDRAPLLGGAP